MPKPHKNSQSVRAHYPNENPPQQPIYMNSNSSSNSSYPVTTNEHHAGNHYQPYYYPYGIENNDNSSNNGLPQSFPHPQFHPPSIPPALPNYGAAPVFPPYSNNLSLHNQSASPHKHQIVENEVPHHILSVPMINNDSKRHSYTQMQPYHSDVYNETTNNNNHPNGFHMLPFPPDFVLREQQTEYGPNQPNHASMDHIPFNNQAHIFHNSPQFPMPPLVSPVIPPPHQSSTSFPQTSYDIHQPAFKQPPLFPAGNASPDMFPPSQPPAPIIPRFSDMSPLFPPPYVSQQQPPLTFSPQASEKDEKDGSQPSKNIFLPVITPNRNTIERSSVRSPEQYQNAEIMKHSNIKTSTLLEMQTRHEYINHNVPSFAAQNNTQLPQPLNKLSVSQNDSIANSTNFPKPIKLEFHNETSSQMASKSGKKRSKPKHSGTGNINKAALKDNISAQGSSSVDNNMNVTEQRKPTKFDKLLNSESSEQKNSNFGRSKPKSSKKNSTSNRNNQLLNNLKSSEPLSKDVETNKPLANISPEKSRKLSAKPQIIVRTSKLSSLLNDTNTTTSGSGISDGKHLDKSISSAKKFRLSSLSSLLQSETEADSVKVSKYPSIIGAIDSDDDNEYFNNRKNKSYKRLDKEEEDDDDDDDDDDLTFGINDEEKAANSGNIVENAGRSTLPPLPPLKQRSINYESIERPNGNYNNVPVEMLGGLNKDLSESNKTSRPQFSFFNQTLEHGQMGSSRLGPIQTDQNLNFPHLLSTQQEWKNFNLKNIKGSFNDGAPVIKTYTAESTFNLQTAPVEKVIKRKGRPPKDLKAKQLKKEKDLLEKERKKAERFLKKKNKIEMKNKLKIQQSSSRNNLSMDSSSEFLNDKSSESDQDLSVKYITDFMDELQRRAKFPNNASLLKYSNQSDRVLLNLKSLNLSRISDVVTKKEIGKLPLVTDEEAIAISEINNLAKRSMSEKKIYENAVQLVNREYNNLAKYYNMSEERRIDHLDSFSFHNKGNPEVTKYKAVEAHKSETTDESRLNPILFDDVQEKLNNLEKENSRKKFLQYTRLEEIKTEIQEILEEGNNAPFIDCYSDELRAYELMRLRNTVKIQRNNNLDIFLGEAVPLVEQSWNLLMSKLNNLESFMRFQKEVIQRCNFDYDLQDSDRHEERGFQRIKKEFLESLLNGYNSRTSEANEDLETSKNLKIQMNMDKERKRASTNSDDDKLTMRRRKRRNYVGVSGGNGMSANKDASFFPEEHDDGGSLHQLNIFTLLDSEDDFQLATNYNFDNILQQIKTGKNAFISESKLMKLVRNNMQEMSKRKSSRHSVAEEKHVEQVGYRSTGGLSTRYYSTTANNNSSEGDSGTSTATVATPSVGRGRPRKKVAVTKGDVGNAKSSQSGSGYYGGSAPPASGGRGGKAKKDLQIYGLSNEDIEKDLAILCGSD